MKNRAGLPATWRHLSLHARLKLARAKKARAEKMKAFWKAQKKNPRPPKPPRAPKPRKAPPMIAQAPEPTATLPVSAGPRTAGYIAAKAGEPRSSCPHRLGTKARTEWIGGWWDANEGRELVNRGGSLVSDRKRDGEAPSPTEKRRETMRANNRAMFKSCRRGA